MHHQLLGTLMTKNLWAYDMHVNLIDSAAAVLELY